MKHLEVPIRWLYQILSMYEDEINKPTKIKSTKERKETAINQINHAINILKKHEERK